MGVKPEIASDNTEKDEQRVRKQNKQNFHTKSKHIDTAATKTPEHHVTHLQVHTSSLKYAVML